MGRALQGRRLTRPLLLVALLLLATHAPTTTAHGLRKDAEEQQAGDKQQIPDAKPVTGTTTTTTTIPPVIEQAAAEPVGAASTVDATEAATALEAELDLSQLPDNEALKSLHEDMLISLMSDSSASSLPASSSLPSSTTTPVELDLSQVPDNEALKSLHEDMLISLMSDSSSASSSDAHRQAFVPQSNAGHRRLQFGGGIPGVGNIGGLMNMGNQAFNAARTGANVINQGVNVVRQGANTAQEMNQLRQDYERRCNLYPGEAEALYGNSVEEEQQQQQQGGRQLQQLLNMGANALKRGAMAYGRDAACPSEEQRQQYLQLKKGATKAYDTVVAPVHGSKELEQQQQQQEQQERMLLQQKVRKVEVEGGREGGLAYMHRQARAAYPRRFLLEAGKKAMPGPVEGGEVVARQEEFKQSNNAIEKTNKNAVWLKEVEGAGAKAREGGKARVSWDDLDDLDIYDNSNEEHDDRGAGPF